MFEEAAGDCTELNLKVSHMAMHHMTYHMVHTHFELINFVNYIWDNHGTITVLDL